MSVITYVLVAAMAGTAAALVVWMLLRRQLGEAQAAIEARALKENREAFLDLAKLQFEGYRKPIDDTLKRVEERLASVDRDRVDTYARLTEKVAALGTTTETLSRAMRTPAVRGRWGEMQLRKIVELTGMMERCDFDAQRTLHGDNGRLRPDLIVHLPGGKHIVVDVKTPLEAYLDAQEVTDEDQRSRRLDAHARQVRDHMEKLSGKAYWEPVEESLEMVVLFLPGEMLFSAALQRDPGLIEHGLRRKVLLASPTTLIGLLTIVAHGWRQEALAENYREVARLGREFYDRLATFADRLDEVRKKLDGAVQAYNEAAGSFESRVLVSARRLKDLKVTTAAELPAAEPIDKVPRVLKQMNLMGIPENARVDDREPT